MTTLVLGGGIIGVTTAYYLAKAGESVTVIDRNNGVAMDTSFANAGLISPGHSYSWASPKAPGILLKSLFVSGQSLRLRLAADPDLVRWGLKFLRNCTSRRAFDNTAAKLALTRYSQQALQALTTAEGLDYQRTSRGLLYLYRSAKALDEGVANTHVLVEGGLPLEVLDRAAVVRLEPALAGSGDSIAGAIYSPGDESGDASLFTQLMFERCKALGVRFEFGVDVRGYEASASHIDAVVTNRRNYHADRYVLAFGPWSARMSRSLGYRLPIYPVKGYSVTFPVREVADAPGIGGVDEQNLIAWARFGERLRFTATAEFAGFNRSHTPEDFKGMIAAARQIFPEAADFESPSYWAGLRPMTPTGLPIIGCLRHDNLLFNTGHGHLGWTMACGSGKIVAEIVSGVKPSIDISHLGIR